ARAAWLEQTRKTGKQRETLARLRHLFGKYSRLPLEAAIGSLHRLVGAMVEAPLQAERPYLVPIALSERVGETAIDGPTCVEPDEVQAVGRSEHRLHDTLSRRQNGAANDPGRANLFRVTEMRVVGQC